MSKDTKRIFQGVIDAQSDLRLSAWMMNHTEYLEFQYANDYRNTEIIGDPRTVDQFASYLSSLGYKET